MITCPLNVSMGSSCSQVSTEAHLKQVMLFNHMILLWVLNDQIDSYNRYCKYFL